MNSGSRHLIEGQSTTGPNSLDGSAAGSAPVLPRPPGRSLLDRLGPERRNSSPRRNWPVAARTLLTHRLAFDGNAHIDLPEPTLDQFIERRPSMFRRILQNRLAMIALAAATLGIALATTAPRPDGPTELPERGARYSDALV